jgi:ParB/RepB/Spo0J family partition protein
MSANEAIASVEEAKVLTLKLEAVRPCDGQPRVHFDPVRLNELAGSLREFGQQVAIIVRELARPEGKVRYEVIDGERRLRASAIAGLKTIRAELRGAKDANHQYVQSVVSNFGREGHTALEAMLAVQRVFDMPEYASIPIMKRYDRVGALFARSGAWTQINLKLMKLPEEVRAMLGAPKERRLNAQVALLLTQVPEAKDQLAIAHDIVERQLKPTEARTLIRTFITGRKPSADVELVFRNVSKIQRFADAVLDMPRKVLVESIATKPKAATKLRQQVSEARDALEQVEQALDAGGAK